jgi:hypothetical protein
MGRGRVQLVTDQDGVQEQTLEILRLLLDPESVEQSVNTFLETFYDTYVDRLVNMRIRAVAWVSDWPSVSNAALNPSAALTCLFSPHVGGRAV